MIVWVNTTTITSATYPSIPFCSFFSKVAFKHIPSKTINPDFVLFNLSENIYHESIHQQINLKIIFDGLFPDNFDSRLYGKIFIPWRGTFWEIDRVLHATVVYQEITKFRLKAHSITTDAKLLAYLEINIAESNSNYKYLKAELNKNLTYFTDAGKRFLKSLTD